MIELIEDEKNGLLKAYREQLDALTIAYNTKELTLERRRKMIESNIEHADEADN